MSEHAGQLWCIFDCETPFDLSQAMIEVELNIDVDGQLHSHAHVTASERVAGVAHVTCYKDWYEQTYRTPFTMSD